MKSIIIILLFAGIPALAQSTLEDYLREAVENNPALKASHLEFEASLQRIPQVMALPNPTLSFGYFLSPIETRVGPQRAKFSLSQMFPWFGTLAAKEDAATLLAEAKYQDFLTARNRLYLQVKSAYYPICEITEQVKWKKENLEILDTYKSLATSSFANGRGAMVDVIRVEIMAENVRTDIRLLESRLKPLEITFNNLLNRETRSSVDIDSLLIIPVLTDYRRDSLLSGNPEILNIDLRMQASATNEILVKKQALPKIGFGIDYSIIEKRTDANVPDNGKNAFMPMVTMSLPIFGKKNKAAVKEVQLTQDALVFKRKDLENNLLSSYELAWYDLHKANQLYDLYNRQIISTQLALDLLYSAYSNSGKAFDDVLAMHQELLKYKMAKATAVKNFYVALAKLDYLTAK